MNLHELSPAERDLIIAHRRLQEELIYNVKTVAEEQIKKELDVNSLAYTDLVSVKEAQEIMGFSSPSSIYSALKKGLIKDYATVGATRVRLAEIQGLDYSKRKN